MSERKYFVDDKGKCWEQRDVYYPGHPDYRRVFVPAPYYINNINAYLFFGPNIQITSHYKPICPDVPEIRAGGKATDGGNLTLSDTEKVELLKTEPLATNFIRPYMMGKEFINNIPRWCLWLVDVEPADIRKCPGVLQRIDNVREFRRRSKKLSTRKKADSPTLFDEPIEIKSDYLAIPIVSSGDRKYIPIGWLNANVIPGCKLLVCENSTLYQFGVISSIVHMAWTRIIGMRLGTSYSYSTTINYNSFPWPTSLKHQRENIERTAQMIIEARAQYPRSSLADLYDDTTMPPELRKAHDMNDNAVLDAYGFREKPDETDIVIALMYMYKDITGCDEYGPSGELIYDPFDWSESF